MGILSNISDENWKSNLMLDDENNIKDSLSNIVTILENDKNLENIVFNTHENCIYVKGNLPWGKWREEKRVWNQIDNSSLDIYMEKEYNIYAPKKMEEALLVVLLNRAYHPIKEYLESLPNWDKLPRVDNLLIDYLGAKDCDYTKEITRKTLKMAVDKIYNPETKFESLLILDGPEGIGKSILFEKLSGNRFLDYFTIENMQNQYGLDQLLGHWIVELNGLEGRSKSDMEKVKTFLSTNNGSDENNYSQFLLVASTNSQIPSYRDNLDDDKFLIVKVSGDSKKKSWDLTTYEVDQIWAEVLTEM
ncbi:MAG: VapE family protein [Terrisporobacter sp.]